MEKTGYRTKLKIGEVQPEREVDGRNGKVKVLDFLATTPEGQANKYGIFAKPELFSHIKTGETIDCDVVEKQREWNGNPVTDRNIMQIYVGGKSVIPPQEKKTWGGGHDSPEQRQSIEAQTAIKEIGECWRAGKFPDGDPLVGLYKGWIQAKLASLVVSTPTAPKAPQRDST